MSVRVFMFLSVYVSVSDFVCVSVGEKFYLCVCACVCVRVFFSVCVYVCVCKRV